MSGRFTSIDAALLLALQRGLPLEPRPFARVGAQLGLSEEAVLAKAAAFVRAGLVRRFGAVFDARSLGYDSTLCAVDVPEADLLRIVARLKPHPGITHCYQRSLLRQGAPAFVPASRRVGTSAGEGRSLGQAGTPSLWFTLTAPAEGLNREIEALSRRVKPYELLNFPARRIFKIGVILDVRRNAELSRSSVSSPPGGGGRNAGSRLRRTRPSLAGKFGECARALVARLQCDLPLVADPFAVVARELNLDGNEMLSLLRDWQARGILRRLGLIPHHRQLGFAVNGMCVWKVASREMVKAGRSLALAPQVTHCYERTMHRRFPFNLYAMLHAPDYAAAQRLKRRLAAQAGLSGGQMLVSIKEFKKSSPQFFGLSSCDLTGRAGSAKRS